MRRSRRNRARVWGRASHFQRGWTLRKFSVRPSPVPFFQKPVFFRNWFNYWAGPPNNTNMTIGIHRTISKIRPELRVSATSLNLFPNWNPFIIPYPRSVFLTKCEFSPSGAQALAEKSFVQDSHFFTGLSTIYVILLKNRSKIE